jgi:hypothetical protein
MRLLILLLFLPIIGISQTVGILDVNWTLTSNTNLNVKKVKGDSLVFVQDDSTDFNPKITMELNSNGKVSSSYVSFIFPTTNGIVTSREGPKPSFSEHRDTLIKGDSTVIRVYKTQDQISFNQPPAFAFIGSYTLKGNIAYFELSLTGIGDDSTVSGPFQLKLRNNELILLKI